MQVGPVALQILWVPFLVRENVRWVYRLGIWEQGEWVKDTSHFPIAKRRSRVTTNREPLA
jgi:hypothetical protein